MTSEPSSRPWRKHALGAAALGVLLISLAANAYLVEASFHYYAATNAVRLDPAGLKTYSADRGAPLDSPELVFFGDSRALMWPVPTTPTGYRILNRGIGNQTTAQMLLRFDEDVAEVHPAVVVIEGGVNDLKSIADFPERRSEIISDCEANLTKIVERSRRLGASVVLVTVFGIGDVSLWRRPFWSSDVAPAVRDVNSYLRTLSGGKVVVLDADPVLLDSQRLIVHQYQADYLHLSPVGYGALNRALIPLLSTLPK